MKRFSVVLSTVILLMLLTVYPVAANYEYSVVEAEFSVPSEFTALYGDDMPETEIFRFIADDNSVELSCYYMEKTDEISFAFLNIADAVDYFLNNLSNIDVGDFIFESVQTYHADGFSNGIMFEGFVEKYDKKLPVFVYAFSTTDNIYGFEFTVYNDSGIYLINEIVDSLYITDYASYIGDDQGNNDEDFFAVLLPLIASVVIGFVSLIVIYINKKLEQKKTAATSYSENQQQSVKSTTEKHLSKKYELNGKNVNIFNERFIADNSDDNFAQKELERERKDREKMFH